MNILIPNATGPINIGDQAILDPTIKLLLSIYPKANIILHSSKPALYKNVHVTKIDFHLVEWALSSKNLFITILRILELITFYFFLRLHLPQLIFNKKLKELANDYKNADLIICVGGGSLRSKKNIKEGIIIGLLSMIYFYSKLFRAKKIIMPISFGPFGYKWHEKIAIHAINNFDLISLREKYSFNLLKKNNVKNIRLAKDFGFLLENSPSVRLRHHKFLLGFTVRYWLDISKQEKFEKDIASALSRFTKEIGAEIKPIVQVNSPSYPTDDDYRITLAIVKNLKELGLLTKKIHILNSLSEAKKSYSSVDLLLGMRMHSNIIAATQGVPFVAISYEHKTEGIVKDLGMEEYVIKCEEVNSQNLYELLMKAYKNRVYLKRTINTSLERIRKQEIVQWNNIFK